MILEWFVFGHTLDIVVEVARRAGVLARAYLDLDAAEPAYSPVGESHFLNELADSGIDRRHVLLATTDHAGRMAQKLLRNYLTMFRKRSGLSQRELSFLLGAKYGSKVSRYERGSRAPSFDALMAFELVFGETTVRLFAGLSARARDAIHRRAQTLFKTLDAQKEFTPTTKRKMDFLADLIYPSKPPHE